MPTDRFDDHASRLATPGIALALVMGVPLLLASAQGQGNGQGGGGGGASDPPPDPAITYFDDRNNNLKVMNADGSNRSVLLSHLAHVNTSAPAFTADGEEVLLKAELDGIWAVWAIRVDGQGMRLVAPVQDYWRWGGAMPSPVPAPDGQYKVVFADAEPGGSSDLYLVNLDGSGLARLLETPDRYETAPRWAPTGDRLTATAGSLGPMIILDLGLGAGGNVQVVGETPLTEVPGSPLQGALVALSAWAYEHSWVVVAAATADSYGNEDLWLIDIDVPAFPMRLTHTPERERWPSFAPDDSVIVFSSSSLGVGQMNNDGSDVVQLAAKAWRPHRRPY